jgi:glutamine synthetase
MFQNFESVSAFINEHAIRMIDLKFTDLWGRAHHVTLSAKEFTPATLQAGVGFDGSSVGLKSVKSGDMALIRLKPTRKNTSSATRARLPAALKPICSPPASVMKAAGGRSLNSTFSIA